jgi:hypothetical protein
VSLGQSLKRTVPHDTEVTCSGTQFCKLNTQVHHHEQDKEMCSCLHTHVCTHTHIPYTCCSHTWVKKEAAKATLHQGKDGIAAPCSLSKGLSHVGLMSPWTVCMVQLRPLGLISKAEQAHWESGDTHLSSSRQAGRSATHSKHSQRQHCCVCCR